MRAGLSHRRVIIVGSGQAGLAVAAALIAKGLQPQQDFVVIDEAAPGLRSWASRWHSMVLLSDARHSALPGLPFPGNQRRRPRVDEMIEYLSDVEVDLGVKTLWGVRATGLERRGSGSVLHLSTTEGEVQTRNVVCATGAATHPRTPTWAKELQVPGVVLHSSEYLYPRQIPTNDVLIVGGGNSGVELARELAPSHAVTLAVRTARRHKPASRYLRRQLFARGSRPEPVFGDNYEQLRDVGVSIRPAVAKAGRNAVTFIDGTVATPGSVILATGFDPGDDWLPDDARTVPPQRTMTGLPGMFVAGIPQYGGGGSDTIAGVFRDATIIARHIIERP